jgi:exosortase H (IPTLxxWG-CTERM-specific)
MEVRAPVVDQTQELQPAPARGATARGRLSGIRGRTATFLIIFLTSVSVLLLGYQYLVDSPLNRWYLFQVAKHTSWALGVVGASSELEHPRLTMDAARARETLDAWARGEPTPTTFHPDKYAGATLSAWDSWRYRAGLMQEHGAPLANDGPYVRFVQRESLQARIQDLSSALARVQHDPQIPDSERAERLGQLEARVASLQAARDELPKSDAGQPIDPRRQFTFRVVAECGAIEAMAIFFSAIIAFPTFWWKRMAGIVVGVPILYGVNILRLTCLGYIGAWDNGGDIFSFAHEYVWQGLYIIFVVAVWLLWVELLVRRVP